MWPTVVGDAVARNAWPLRVARDGTLHVATAAPATWAHELDLLQEAILDGLRSRLGDQRRRECDSPQGRSRSRRHRESRPRRPPRRPVEVPPEIASEAAAAAAEIDDEELRELVARAARASLLKARSGRSFW